MTGNVAQVFVTDHEWTATLAGVRAALRPGGHLVFETRDPSRRAWDEWTEAQTTETVDTRAGRVQTWVDVVDVSLPLVTFRSVVRFIDERNGATELVSHSTLRFRERDEIEASLAATGYAIDGVRDAPDRPAREWVFVCRAAPLR